MHADAQVRRENLVPIAHIYTSTAAIALGAVFGVLQGFSRAKAVELPSWFDYYRILTMHGILMALVFTTFFITGLSLFCVYRAAPRDRSLATGWIGWFVMILGTAMAAAQVIAGNATVLYTFYTPLKASPWFYIGATLLSSARGSSGTKLLENAAYWKRQNPGKPLPLVVFTISATFIMWFIATLGVAIEMLGFIIPWSFGWTPRHQRDDHADALLVLRTSARLLLDHGRLHRLVQRYSDALSRQRLQRWPHASHVRHAVAALDAGRHCITSSWNPVSRRPGSCSTPC